MVEAVTEIVSEKVEQLPRWMVDKLRDAAIHALFDLSYLLRGMNDPSWHENEEAWNRATHAIEVLSKAIREVVE